MQIFVTLTLLLGAVNTWAFQLESAGIQNCPNKCDKVFDRLQYAIADQPNQDTFEFRSCILGCNRCQNQLSTGKVDQSCFKWCKTFDYGAAGIRKGVIEPDKACIMGCVINTCQEVCTGGTTDHSVTPDNQNLWWGLGGNGCSIKSGLGYVQSPNYVNPNAPEGQGAAGENLRKCCANALNLCQYNGDKSSTNYANVILVARRTCKRFVVNTEIDTICAFQNNPQNCGTPGLQP